MNSRLSQTTTIIDLFDELPTNQEKIFKELWLKGKLRFEDAEHYSDEIDINTAKLLNSAIVKKQPFLVIFPDHAPRRVPQLFATALIFDAFNSIEKNFKHSVIYFGNSAAIKSYLNKLFIGKQKLSEIFEHEYLGKSAAQKQSNSLLSNLPKIFFSYSPLEPENLLTRIRPYWIFLDCGDGQTTEWIKRVIDFCRQKQILILASSQNFLSECVEYWRNAGWKIFSWNYTPNSVECSPKAIELIPIVIESEITSEYSEKFRNAYRLLCESNKSAKGLFEQKSIRVLWKYLRSLENLTVPLDFFEIESKYFWPFYSISQLRDISLHFLKSLDKSKVLGLLQEAYQELDKVYQNHKKYSNPLWIALQHLCIDSPDKNSANILIFQNRSHKHLFAHALLAKENIAETDLAEINVWLASLKEYRQWQLAKERSLRIENEEISLPNGLKNDHSTWHPILIGVPLKHKYCYYSFLFEYPQVGILNYPHQYPVTKAHIKSWIGLYNKTSEESLTTLQYFILPNRKITNRKIINNPRNKTLTLGSETYLEIEKLSEECKRKFISLLSLPTRVEEIELMMKAFESEGENEELEENISEDHSNTDHGGKKLLLQEVLYIQFKEGYYVLLDLYDSVQVVLTDSGKVLDERSARSIRSGDKILFINGHRRQNLYDLIISRIHDHPSFTLHINLIKRWKDELRKCYINSNLSIEKIHSKMQIMGSTLETPLAIQHWLTGIVMCPLNKDDLLRIAEILDMTFTKLYYKQIDRAASRIRGIHRSLARKLNVWLKQGSIFMDESEMYEVIDPELGLNFKDFKDALMILTVKSIEKKEGIFLSTELGQVKKRG